jgi:hypothetical protein
MMQELTELRLSDNRLILENNIVKSAILPHVVSELGRDIVVKGEVKVEGAVYANLLELNSGLLEIMGAVFTQMELHVNADADGIAVFHKAVGSASSIMALSPRYRTNFRADVHAEKVKLRNAFVAGSIFAEEIYLEDCVVIGGAFASQRLDVKNVILGTFNATQVNISGNVFLLLPSAFSVERMHAAPDAALINLSLADLGGLFRNQEAAPNSGKIIMSLASDEIKTELKDGERQMVVRSYSVIGKVLAADLLDTDKFNNHILLTSAALGPQLLKNYNLEVEDGSISRVMSFENIAVFFFQVLNGSVDISTISGKFTMDDIMRKFQ